MTNALLIHPDDDVAVVTQSIVAGEEVSYGAVGKIKAIENITIYHKIALRNICKGEVVHKYNSIIGEAIEDIQMGQHVHVHNLKSITKEER